MTKSFHNQTQVICPASLDKRVQSVLSQSWKNPCVMHYWQLQLTYRLSYLWRLLTEEWLKSLVAFVCDYFSVNHSLVFTASCYVLSKEDLRQEHLILVLVKRWTGSFILRMMCLVVTGNRGTWPYSVAPITSQNTLLLRKTIFKLDIA